MDIAAMSMQMSTAKVMQQASLIMTKKSMDMQEATAAGLIDMMKTAGPQLPAPRLDIRA